MPIRHLSDANCTIMLKRKNNDFSLSVRPCAERPRLQLQNDPSPLDGVPYVKKHIFLKISESLSEIGCHPRKSTGLTPGMCTFDLTPFQGGSSICAPKEPYIRDAICEKTHISAPFMEWN